MKEVQLDIFGGATPLEELPKPLHGRRYRTMQEQYGKIEGKTCKTCAHLVQKRCNRTFYKCELWYISDSEATDIRLKNQACGRYEEVKE